MSAVWQEMTHSVMKDADSLAEQVEKLPLHRYGISKEQFLKYCSGISATESAGKPLLQSVLETNECTLP